MRVCCGEDDAVRAQFRIFVTARAKKNMSSVDDGNEGVGGSLSADSKIKTTTKEMVSSSNNNFIGNGSGGGGKQRPGRPSKKSLVIICGWCEEAKPPLLKYVWENEKKEFCSKSCIAQFREAHRKGVCLQCDNILMPNPVHKDYCSAFCQTKYQRTHGGGGGGAAAIVSTAVSVDQPGGSGTVAIGGGGGGGVGVAGSPGGVMNNNNNNVNNNNQQFGTQHRVDSSAGSTSAATPTTAPARTFQYESFNVFNWDDYLKVNTYMDLLTYMSRHMFGRVNEINKETI